MITTLNQEFVSFNEPIIYFQLIGTKLLVIFSFLAKHLSKYVDLHKKNTEEL